MKQKWVVIDIRVNEGRLEVQRRNQADGVVSDWEAVAGWGNNIKSINWASAGPYTPRRLPSDRR